MSKIESTEEKEMKEMKEKYLKIQTRPNASSGFWLCTLLPLCFLFNLYKYQRILTSNDYLLTITVIGFNLQSISFFTYLCLKTTRITSICCTFMPNIITSFLLYYFIYKNFLISFSYAFLILFIYQYLYLKILKYLPKSFTLGELSIILQGILLFIINAIKQIPNFYKEKPNNPLDEMKAIMMTALLALIVVGLIFSLFKFTQHTVAFYLIMLCYVIFVCLIPITKDLPIITIINFITNDPRRIIIIAFYFTLIGLTTISIIFVLNKFEKATTSIRKIFHIIIVFVFAPGILYQCTLLYIATGVALAFLIIFEMIRILKIPPFYEFFEKTVQLFVDQKDSGLIAFTPIYLLIGCSLPLWINPIPCLIKNNVIPLMSGLITIGIGDTAASIIGSKYGQLKWTGNSKSIEGTIANAISQSAAITLLIGLGYVQITNAIVLVTPLAILLTSFVEAFTDQIDNLVLPLIFYIISNLT